MNFLDRINQKLEVFRLEQRYTRQRSRRTTFVSEAQYIDGEYVYAPNSPHSQNLGGGVKRDAYNTEPRAVQCSVASRIYRMGLDWKRKGDMHPSTSSNRADGRMVTTR
ncbi:hypothetical protein K3495_g1381 [Podosphaera aphanis]|nr:hypothetical protein K3495_g1381 [Podosphaera aphanis]